MVLYIVPGCFFAVSIALGSQRSRTKWKMRSERGSISQATTGDRQEKPATTKAAAEPGEAEADSAEPVQ